MLHPVFHPTALAWPVDYFTVPLRSISGTHYRYFLFSLQVYSGKRLLPKRANMNGDSDTEAGCKHALREMYLEQRQSLSRVSLLLNPASISHPPTRPPVHTLSSRFTALVNVFSTEPAASPSRKEVSFFKSQTDFLHCLSPSLGQAHLISWHASVC